MLEHGAYTLLMDSCYDREQFPTLEQAYDWCWARSEEEKDAIRFVLEKFFTKEGDVYVQHRIQEEIDKYQENCIINKRIAREREEKRKGVKTKRERSVNEAPPNQEPITKNHKPRTKPKSKNKFSDEDMELAREIFDCVLVVAPKTKEPSFEKWANDLRLMREQDGHTHNEIRNVFLFANTDNFWKTNILSTGKLREKFSQLHSRMSNGDLNGHTQQPNYTNQADEAFFRKYPHLRP